jgi:ketosteroid isomerase-like protein
MKRIPAVLGLMAASCLLAAGGALARSPANAKVEKAIQDLEMRRYRAMVEGDVTALERILADDLTYSHSNGWTQTKSEFINSIRRGELAYEEIKPDALEVRVYGRTAVVTGRAHVKAKVKGQDVSIELRFLDVYIQRQGSWQMVAWQSARLAM